MEPEFLTRDEVVELHLDQIASYGGDPSLRDAGLLESALAQPSASFGGSYLCGDLFDMAAAYLFHIVKNHPFVDGNKRTGAVAALLFLKLNGIEIVAAKGELAAMVLEVACGTLSKPTIAQFFRDHAHSGIPPLD